MNTPTTEGANSPTPRPPAPVDAEWIASLADELCKHSEYALGKSAVRAIIRRHAHAESAQLAAITADRNEWKADSERLKAREVTLTDRQVLVQMALKQAGFDFEAGEGLPELVKRVAGMASAYRARDNIGMSREEYHAAKTALARIATLEAERDRLAAEVKLLTEVDFKNAALIDKLQDERNCAEGDAICKGAACATLRDKLIALEAERDRLREALSAANHGDVPAGWDAAIDRAEKAESALIVTDERVMELQVALSGLLKASIEYDYAAHEEARREAGVQLIAARTAASRTLGRCPQGLDMGNPAAPLDSGNP